jgi:hypothetical protein
VVVKLVTLSGGKWNLTRSTSSVVSIGRIAFVRIAADAEVSTLATAYVLGASGTEASTPRTVIATLADVTVENTLQPAIAKSAERTANCFRRATESTSETH